MESSILTAVFLPLALCVIMLGMGLTLTSNNFRHVVLAPKAVVLGLVLQIVALPLVAFAIAKLTALPPDLAVGLMILSACPGGPTSNLITHLAKGDSALSITLTAFSSCFVVLTAPLIIEYAGAHFIGDGRHVSLPVLQTIVQIFAVTVAPVSIGMWLKARYPALAQRCESPVKILSALFLAILVLGAIIKERHILFSALASVGSATILLNVVSLALGFGMARLFGLGVAQRRSISIEVGIQNGTLGIAIAASPTLLNNAAMAIPSAVYSLVMFGSGAVLIGIALVDDRISKRSTKRLAA